MLLLILKQVFFPYIDMWVWLGYALSSSLNQLEMQVVYWLQNMLLFLTKPKQ